MRWLLPRLLARPVSFLLSSLALCFCEVRIPRKLYTFWDGPLGQRASLPASAEAAIGTWKRLSPEFEVIVLSRSNVAAYLTREAETIVLGPVGSVLNLRSLADLIRFEVIAEHGGVWLDATAALAEPLSTWVPEGPTAELVGFDLDFGLLEASSVDLSQGQWERHFSNGRLIAKDRHVSNASQRFLENWGFAAAPGCPALVRWRDAFRALVTHPAGLDEAVNLAAAEEPARSSLDPSFKKWLPYLSPGFAMWTVRQAEPELQIRARPAEDWAFAHLYYMPDPSPFGPAMPHDYFTDWAGGPMFALARAANASPGPPPMGKILKLRTFERCALDAIIGYRSFAPTSPLVRLFALKKAPSWWPHHHLAEPMAAFEASKCEAPDPFLKVLWPVLKGCFQMFFLAVENSMKVLSFFLMVIVFWQYASRGARADGGPPKIENLRPDLGHRRRQKRE